MYQVFKKNSNNKLLKTFSPKYSELINHNLTITNNIRIMKTSNSNFNRTHKMKIN